MPYTTVSDVKAFAKVTYQDLGYTDQADFDNFVSSIIEYAEGIINDHLNTTFTTAVPDTVKYVCTQICANILHQILQRKISPTIRVDDYTLRLLIPEAFTNELKRMLKPYRVFAVERETE